MVPLLSSIGLHESLHIFDTFSKVSSSRLDPTNISDASSSSGGGSSSDSSSEKERFKINQGKESWSYLNSLKKVWSKGFTYKGESSKKEFLEYYLL